MRNLPFLFVCARPMGESVAAAAVRIAPFFRNVRRVIGEKPGLVAFAFIIWIGLSSTDQDDAQGKAGGILWKCGGWAIRSGRGEHFPSVHPHNQLHTRFTCLSPRAR